MQLQMLKLSKSLHICDFSVHILCTMHNCGYCEYLCNDMMLG